MFYVILMYDRNEGVPIDAEYAKFYPGRPSRSWRENCLTFAEAKKLAAKYIKAARKYGYRKYPEDLFCLILCRQGVREMWRLDLPVGGQLRDVAMTKCIYDS